MVSTWGLLLDTLCFMSHSVNAPFFIAAIYLAKRNIRKKGILELHEQVRMAIMEPLMTHLACCHSLRCDFLSSGAV